jgi:antitoxin (DNA-binding transcriptional repressor) of toxin-antitoxin stability system
MTSVSIRQLERNLSPYIRRLKQGETIAVTDRGRIVAELRLPANAPVALSPRHERYTRLVAAGIIQPAVARGDPLADWPSAREVELPPGALADLIGDDRGL